MYGPDGDPSSVLVVLCLYLCNDSVSEGEEGGEGEGGGHVSSGEVVDM